MRRHLAAGSQDCRVRVFISGWGDAEPLRTGHQGGQPFHPLQESFLMVTNHVQGRQLGILVCWGGGGGGGGGEEDITCVQGNNDSGARG